jgi:hypothetical protein
MEKSYETFVTDLRKLLLAAMDLKEEEIYFSNDGEKYGCLGDREWSYGKGKNSLRVAYRRTL